MNKQEAAEFLGIGVRSLECYTQENRVAATYKKGKTRSVLDYEPSELERFKAEMPVVDRQLVARQRSPKNS